MFLDALKIGMIIDSPPWLLPRHNLTVVHRLKQLLQSFSGNSSIIYGATVAYSNFTEKIVCHSDRHIFYLFCTPGTYQDARVAYASLPPSERQRFILFPHNDLIKMLKVTEFFAWLDVSGFVTAPFDVRSAYDSKLFPVVVSHHTLSYPSQLHETYLKLIMSDSKVCDAFVCTSNAAKKMVDFNLARVSDLAFKGYSPQVFRGSTPVIPLGVDCSSFYPRDQQICRKHFGFSRNETVALYLGRLSVSDKCDLLPLVYAFQKVRQQNSKAPLRLVIAGQSIDGYGQLLYRKIREAGLAANVSFISHLDNSDKPLLFGASDVFVSPSDNLQESFGQTVIEAMASGIPQIASDWDGYRDTIVHGKTGFLVPTMWGQCTEDIDALSQVFSGREMGHFLMSQSVSINPDLMVVYLERLLTDQALRARMSEESRQRALAVYDWKRICARYIALIEESNEKSKSIRNSHSESYRRPASFKAASHFASEILTDDSILQRTDRGISIKGGMSIPYIDKSFSAYNEYEHWDLDKIMSALDQRLTIADLRDRLRIKDEWDQYRFYRQILWLLKYAWVSTVPTANFPNRTGSSAPQLGRDLIA